MGEMTVSLPAEGEQIKLSGFSIDIEDLEAMTAEERIELANAITELSAEILPWGRAHPVGQVQWIHISRVQANDYNPNSVANQEMKLLWTSISSDGYTQPVVAIWDPEAAGGEGRYVIVDGFHRYSIMRVYADIMETTGGYLPVVVIDKSPADRIASTVRHNRARGSKTAASGVFA